MRASRWGLRPRARGRSRSGLLFLLVTGLASGAAATTSSCSSQSLAPDLGPATFHVQIDSVNGNTTLPTAAMPLPANHGDGAEHWAFTIEARKPTGELASDFNGYVRLTARPGTVVSVSGNGAQGRNILVTGGKVSGTVDLTAVYGPARLWVEDLGYLPAAPGKVPACSNGLDDNKNGLIDFPADPGCFYADDDSEDGGSYAAGISPPIEYGLPKVSDVRGGAHTPYPNEAIEIATGDPQRIIVTRIASDGFYITDVNPTEMSRGYNSLFAYNFSAPPNMRVCDRITYLSGTANDFFGFTELSFPSFKNAFVVLGHDGGVTDLDAGLVGCEVPEPTVLDPSLFTGDKNTTAKNLRKVESSLVRLVGFQIAANFGSGLAVNNNFAPGVSNCDFNGNGQIDFTQTASATSCAPRCEGDCATLCDSLPDCTEWTGFSARNEYKVSLGTAATMIKINTGTIATFDPVGNAGQKIDFVSGTLREFSGGTLNWTVEARCPDDLVCPATSGCVTQKPVSSQTACVRLRTVDDNDQGTN